MFLDDNSMPAFCRELGDCLDSGYRMVVLETDGDLVPDHSEGVFHFRLATDAQAVSIWLSRRACELVIIASPDDVRFGNEGSEKLASEFIGNPILGYKMAYCQRDTAMYTSMLLAGMVFGLVRRRLRPLPLSLYLVSLVPWAVDGLAQLFGFYESTWQLRTITGSLFGLATVWFAYPYLEAGMGDLRHTIGEKPRLE